MSACRPEAIAILSQSKKLENLEIKSLRHSQVDFRAVGESPEEFTARTRRAMQKALPALAKNQNFSYLQIDGPLGLTREDLVDFCRKSKIKSLELQESA